MSLSLFSLMYGGGGGRRRWGSSSKPKKKKKENWFERLTVDQNKQLCKAAKLRHVGNKKELIARLLEEEQTSKYALEAHRVGLNVERIKAMCRERGLQVGGSKFDLVLRVLHCDNGTTPAGETLKRAAATGADPSGAPKRRKKAAPSASRVYARVQKKIEAVTQKKYQSHWGSKTHSTDVYDLVASILDDVVNSEERYLETKPRFAMTLAEAACTSLTDNFDTMCRKGYDDGGGWEIIDSRLRQIADAARPVLSAEEREAFADWIQALHDEGEQYCLTMDTDLVGTIEFLRGADGRKGEGAVEDGASPKKAGADPPGNEIGAAKENVVNA